MVNRGQYIKIVNVTWQEIFRRMVLHVMFLWTTVPLDQKLLRTWLRGNYFSMFSRTFLAPESSGRTDFFQVLRQQKLYTRAVPEVQGDEILILGVKCGRFLVAKYL